MFLVAAAILAVIIPPTHASTLVLDKGSAALIAQTRRFQNCSAHQAV